MGLIRKSLVFLDTGPLRNYRAKKSEYSELFRHSTVGSIKLCTSWMSIQEWVEQKVSHYRGYKNGFSSLLGENCFAEALLDKVNFPFPDEQAFREQSYIEANRICESNSIEVFASTKEHIDRTWGAYFRIAPPFTGKNNKENIPDSWVYEAALDALNTYQALPNRFAISSELNRDGKLSKFLNLKGFEIISIPDLLKKLVGEESEQVSTQQPPIQTAALQEDDPVRELDVVLSQFVGSEFRQVATRILGYSLWFKAPSREFLRVQLQAKGHQVDQIEACSQLLSFGENAPITLTSGNYIPRKLDICRLAAEKIKTEILDLLAENA